jgi:hypothetical protein
MKKDKAEELALITAMIAKDAPLKGIALDTFDKYYKIAKAFVRMYGVERQDWDLMDFEEEVYSFYINYIKLKQWR